eukprot:scaffold91542_cov54-Phaeocystis_antarctica.AAC.1
MSVSDSSRYIRSRAQYAAKWCVVVTVEPPKGTEGITRHDEASLSQHMAAKTGGRRRPSKRSVAMLYLRSEGRAEAGDWRAMAQDCTRSCSGRTGTRTKG